MTEVSRSVSGTPPPEMSNGKFQDSLRRLSVHQQSGSGRLSPMPQSSPAARHTPPPTAHAWSGIVDVPQHNLQSFEANDESIVRYGDKIRLFSKSRYLTDESNVEGGYAGYYFRSRKGVKGEEGKRCAMKRTLGEEGGYTGNVVGMETLGRRRFEQKQGGAHAITVNN